MGKRKKEQRERGKGVGRERTHNFQNLTNGRNVSICFKVSFPGMECPQNKPGHVKMKEEGRWGTQHLTSQNPVFATQ